jgi:hypothetical protein
MTRLTLLVAMLTISFGFKVAADPQGDDDLLFKVPLNFSTIPATFTCDPSSPVYNNDEKLPVNSSLEIDGIRYNAWRLFVALNANFRAPDDLKKTDDYIPRWGTWLKQDERRDITKTYQVRQPFCHLLSDNVPKPLQIGEDSEEISLSLPQNLCEEITVKGSEIGDYRVNDYLTKLAAYLENNWSDLDLPRSGAIADDWRCTGACLKASLALGSLFKNTNLGAGLLQDIKGNNIYYEARLNPMINIKYLTDTKFDAKAAHILPQGMCQKSVTNDWFGYIQPSIVVKIAWKVLDKDELKTDFLTLNQVSIQNVAGKVDLAMVAMHIAIKEEDYTNWRWITFEHQNTVDPQGDNDPPLKASEALFNHKDYNTVKLPNTLVTRTVNPSPITYADIVGPNLFREVPIDDEVIALNQDFKQWLKGQQSPLANYNLIDVHFTKKTSNNGTTGDNHAKQLRNTILEPYSVSKNQDECQNHVAIAKGKGVNILYNQCLKKSHDGGCLSCHKKVSKDFDFIFALKYLESNINQEK